MKNDDFIGMIDEMSEAEEYGISDEVMAAPEPTDEGWYDFLIDNLYENELVQGNPTTDGLRRLTEKFYGEIVKSKSDVIDTEHDGNGLRCTVRHTLLIRKYETGTLAECDACINVDYRGVPHPFNRHVVATADTRAEGKALRPALTLRDV